MCLSLFAMASMDFFDQEYFDSIMLNFIETKHVPHIDQLCFLIQACAILRRSEYTKTLLQWFKQVMFNFQFNLFDPSQRQKDAKPWEMKSEKQLISAMQGIAYLMGSSNDHL